MLIINQPLLLLFSPDLQLSPAGETALHFSPAEDKEDTKDDDDDQSKTGSYLGRLLSTYETFPALPCLPPLYSAI